MGKKIKSRLGFGPMSPEIIEGIVKTSSEIDVGLMLISTENQINRHGGYVNNWKTGEYVDFVNQLRKKYPGNLIYICRDHCGPGFKNNGIKEVYETIDDDINNGFNLIHIDFSRMGSNKLAILKETRKAVEEILRRTDDVAIEIGTEENVGVFKDNLQEIRNELDCVMQFVTPEFFVVQTGSLVREINQVGRFNREFIARVHELLSSRGVKLKEHNADYLDRKRIRERREIVDAMNIAPQLGVIQTQAVISEALVYGIDVNPFLNKSYESGAWRKWMNRNTEANRMLCSVIAGHYNFTTEEYKRLISELEKYVDIKVMVIDKIVSLVRYYSDALEN